MATSASAQRSSVPLPAPSDRQDQAHPPATLPRPLARRGGARQRRRVASETASTPTPVGDGDKAHPPATLPRLQTGGRERRPRASKGGRGGCLNKVKQWSRLVISTCTFFALIIRTKQKETQSFLAIQKLFLPIIGQQFVNSFAYERLSFYGASSADVETAIHGKVKELNTQNIRYYLYDEPNITLEEWLFKRHPDLWWKAEEKNDEQMLKALESAEAFHWRTLNPDDADLFIVPIPFAKLLMQSKWNPLHHVNDMQRKTRAKPATAMAVQALMEHPLFQKYRGERHVVLNTPDACYRYGTPLHPFYDIMSPFYGAMYNVTAMLSFDPNAVYNDLKYSPNAERDTWHEYFVPFQNTSMQEPVSRWSASIGLGDSNQEMELIPASLEKFWNSTNFIFYHSRKEGGWFNSTIYRHAPITNITNATGLFPKSSIGWGLEGKEWTRQFRTSKFCLVVRGDNPMSHSHWRSIRNGCIPVIASDSLPIYSPLFKSTLNVRDYAVIVREREFVDDPEKALLKLNQLSDFEIEAKIKHLAFAQRVVFTDHPQSLFVPAFLREATMATEVQLVGLK